MSGPFNEGNIFGWHCTPAVNRISIEQEGLRAPTSLSLEYPMVDFIADLTEEAEIAVFFVVLDGLTIYPDDDGWGHVQIRELITPDRIRLDRLERIGA